MQQQNVLINDSCEHSPCKDIERCEEDPWSGILKAITVAARSAVHAATQSKSPQLVFGCDAIFNIQHRSNWKRICEREQKTIRINNMKENVKRLSHAHTLGDLVLIEADQKTQHGSNTCQGLFPIIGVNDNGKQSDFVKDQQRMRATHGCQLYSTSES
jgi:hypothetical protein